MKRNISNNTDLLENNTLNLIDILTGNVFNIQQPWLNYSDNFIIPNDSISEAITTESPKDAVYGCL